MAERPCGSFLEWLASAVSDSEAAWNAAQDWLTSDTSPTLVVDTVETLPSDCVDTLADWLSRATDVIIYEGPAFLNTGAERTYVYDDNWRDFDEAMVNAYKSIRNWARGMYRQTWDWVGLPNVTLERLIKDLFGDDLWMFKGRVVIKRFTVLKVMDTVIRLLRNSTQNFTLAAENVDKLIKALRKALGGSIERIIAWMAEIFYPGLKPTGVKERMDDILAFQRICEQCDRAISRVYEDKKAYAKGYYECLAAWAQIAIEWWKPRYIPPEDGWGATIFFWLFAAFYPIAWLLSLSGGKAWEDPNSLVGGLRAFSEVLAAVYYFMTDPLHFHKRLEERGGVIEPMRPYINSVVSFINSLREYKLPDWVMYGAYCLDFYRMSKFVNPEDSKTICEALRNLLGGTAFYLYCHLPKLGVMGIDAILKWTGAEADMGDLFASMRDGGEYVRDLIAGELPETVEGEVDTEYDMSEAAKTDEVIEKEKEAATSAPARPASARPTSPATGKPSAEPIDSTTMAADKTISELPKEEKEEIEKTPEAREPFRTGAPEGETVEPQQTEDKTAQKTAEAARIVSVEPSELTLPAIDYSTTPVEIEFKINFALPKESASLELSVETPSFFASMSPQPIEAAEMTVKLTLNGNVPPNTEARLIFKATTQFLGAPEFERTFEVPIKTTTYSSPQAIAWKVGDYKVVYVIDSGSESVTGELVIDGEAYEIADETWWCCSGSDTVVLRETLDLYGTVVEVTKEKPLPEQTLNIPYPQSLDDLPGYLKIAKIFSKYTVYKMTDVVGNPWLVVGVKITDKTAEVTALHSTASKLITVGAPADSRRGRRGRRREEKESYGAVAIRRDLVTGNLYWVDQQHKLSSLVVANKDGIGCTVSEVKYDLQLPWTFAFDVYNDIAVWYGSAPGYAQLSDLIPHTLNVPGWAEEFGYTAVTVAATDTGVYAGWVQEAASPDRPMSFITFTPYDGDPILVDAFDDIIDEIVYVPGTDKIFAVFKDEPYSDEGVLRYQSSSGAWLNLMQIRLAFGRPVIIGQQTLIVNAIDPNDGEPMPALMAIDTPTFATHLISLENAYFPVGFVPAYHYDDESESWKLWYFTYAMVPRKPGGVPVQGYLVAFEEEV